MSDDGIATVDRAPLPTRLALRQPPSQPPVEVRTDHVFGDVVEPLSAGGPAGARDERNGGVLAL